MRPAGARGSGLGPLPDAQPRPSDPDAANARGSGRALGKAHRRYSAFVNARMRVTGHLFQARFSSVVMDEDHLMAAARYVALNPVRARLAARSQDWPWSSVRAHLAGRDDGLVEVAPLIERVGGRFADLIATAEPGQIAALRAAERSAAARRGPLPRPLEALTGRRPRPGRRGRKPQARAAKGVAGA